MTDSRLPLTLLGGALGSGKTTWLRHQLHMGRHRDSAILVNEAAELAIDDRLLPGAVPIAGGCACCARLPDLLAHLRALADQRHARGLAAILLETSGLADPGAIVAAIRADPILARHIRLAETIVTIDALHGLAQLRAESLARAQVAAADRLILTKTDAADPDTTARLAATLGVLAPAARIEAAILGVPAAVPEPSTPEPLAEVADGVPLAAMRLDLAGIDWTCLAIWLSALLHARGDEFPRIKGVVRAPAGRLLIQTVRKVVQSPEILSDQPEEGDDSLILVGREGATSELYRSLRHFARA